MNTTHDRISCGFTVIELLAVIGVVGVLAGLLFAVLGRARDSARQATCASNMRQIGAGLFLYAADHKNTLPAVSTTWAPADQQTTWGWKIWTYVGYDANAFRFDKSNPPMNDLSVRDGAIGTNIFNCPATRAEQICFPGVASVNANKFSYGLSSNPFGWTYNDTWTAPIPLSLVVSPPRCAMVTEDSFCLGDSEGYLHLFGLMPHHGGSNVLFYDGHVEYRKAADIPTNRLDVFWIGR